MRSRRIPNIALEALVDIYIISSCQDKYGWESLTATSNRRFDRGTTHVATFGNLVTYLAHIARVR